MSEPAPESLAVHARGLVRRFGDVVAVDGLDLDVPAATCFGLLGPNGAGKTTTVSMLATLLRPDAGRALVFGHDVAQARDAVRRELGIVFQASTLDLELTAREQLDLHARLHHLDGRARRVDEALARAGLGEAADRPVRGFSGGMRRRLEIVRALLHAPRLLFLDEPSLGLDLSARGALWESLRRLRDESGTTLFLTTHSMQEADALCDRIAIVDRGRVVVEGAPPELRSALGGDVVVMAVEREDGLAERLARVDGVQRVASDPGATGAARLRVVVRDGARRIASLVEAAREHGVIEVELHRPTLEHVFLHHTGHPFEPETELGAR